MRTATRRALDTAIVGLAAIACLTLPGDGGQAATHDADAMAADVEIVVVEAPGCIYCPIFRRDVLPSYQASPRAKAAPLRFLDINDEAADKLPLNGPVTIVPTVIILKEHREIGRIPGYIGPDNFFHTVDSVLSAK